MKIGFKVWALVLVTWLIAAAGQAAEQGKAREAQDQSRNVTKAIVDLKVLDTAIVSYFVVNGVYPDTLESMTKPQPNGRPPLLKEIALKDPWDRLFRYEPKNLHPKTGKPLIYSHGPDPSDPKSRISSWDAFEAKKK